MSLRSLCKRRGMDWVLLALLAWAPAFLLFRTAPAWAEAQPGDEQAKADAGHPDVTADDPADFLRFVDDHHGGGKLESAIATYKNEKGQTVHLVGALHIGEPAYYAGLNKSFARYDAVLYELVKPAGMGAPARGMKSKSMIGMFQRFLKDQLDLDFQLDDIDYTKVNFVHADLDAETFEKMEQERGESLMGIMLSQMMSQMAKQMAGGNQQAAPEMDLADLVDALTSPDRSRILKLMLARQFGNLEEQMAGMDGTVLVTERNKKAISVLRDELKAGKKDIGIFYGAGHMHDLESRIALMGFHRTGIEWRTAWDMTEKAGDPATRPADE